MSSEKNLNAYRGVLKNKKLGKILNDGFNAPVGSTKRKHAQRIFSIIKKTSNDGAGGPGASTPKINMQLQPRSYDYGNMVIFPATPKVRVPIGSKAPAYYPEAIDGKGGPSSPFGTSQYSSLLAGGKLQLPSAPSGNGLSNFSGVSSQPGQQTYGGGASTLTAGGQNLYGSNKPSQAITNMFSGMNVEDATRMNPQQDILSPAMKNFNVKGNAQPNQQNGGLSGININPDVSKTMNAKDAGFMGAFGVPLGKRQQETGTPAPAQAGQQQGPVQFTNLNNEVSNKGILNPADKNATGIDTTDALRSKFPNIQSSVDANIGPSLFAYQALNKGTDYLKSLPGMQGIPDSILQGGTLADRLKTLDGTLRKQYNLDQLLNNYSDMVKGGATIEGRMTDYIRGRDEFLNETDGLISDLKQAYNQADTSDPRTKANMQNNMNYLYEMKGRQNKRYVEFLKMSVDEYGSRVNASENLYKMRHDEYSTALANDANITTEQYNTMYTGLQEMYATVADAPLKQLQMLEAKGKLLSAYGDVAGDTGGYISGSSATYEEQYKTLSNVNTIDKEGRWINSPNAVFTGGDATTFVQIMENGVYQAITQPIKEGDSTRQPSQSEIGDTIGNALGHLAILQQSGSITPDAYNRSVDKLEGMALTAIGSSGIIPIGKVSQYRDAINALDGKQPWLWFNSTTPKKQDFLSSYTDLNQQVLGGLYDQLQIYLNQGENKKASDWVSMKLSNRGALGQEGAPLDDKELRNVLLKNFTNSFKAQEITPSQVT